MSLKEPYQTIANKLYELLIDSRCEGKVDYLYLDINGLLHTGIGMNLEPSPPSKETVRAQLHIKIPQAGQIKEKMVGPAYPPRLSWKRKNIPVGPIDIYQAIWKVRLKAILDPSCLASGTAKTFINTTDIRLENENIIRRDFDSGVNMRISVLKKCFPQFDTFPADARLAMLVHAWAMHPRMNSKGILVAGVSQTKWPGYTAAIKERRWWDKDHPKKDPGKPTAAEECHWKGMSDYRYKNMVEMYHQAYLVEENRKKGIQADLNTVHWVKLT